MTIDPEATSGPEEAAVCASDLPHHDILVFQDQPLRIVRDDAEPWFWVAAIDICKALATPSGARPTPAKLLTGLDADATNYEDLPTPKGVQRLAIVSADGVKALCAKRNTKAAKALRALIHREVRRMAPAKPKRSEPAPVAPGCIQPLNGQPIPFVIVDDLPHYCAGSIARALGLDVRTTLAERVADAHMKVAPIPTAGGELVEGAVLTPIGIFTLALYHELGTQASTHKWVFRETKRLNPDAFDRKRHGAAAMMALRPDGDVPPRPHARSGRQDEWRDLKQLPQYRNPRSVIGAMRFRKNNT